LSTTKYAAVKVRIADELERYLSVAVWLRNTLEGQMYGTFGATKEVSKVGIAPALTKQWKECVDAFDTLVNAKVRLDKNAKLLSDSMSAEEERAAVIAYIKSIEAKERTLLLAELNAWHTQTSTPSPQ
jgi:hypothetical protein